MQLFFRPLNSWVYLPYLTLPLHLYHERFKNMLGKDFLCRSGNHSNLIFRSIFLVQMSGREIDAFLEERLHDIDELIQSELGFASLNITKPFTAPEIHNLGSLLETGRTVDRFSFGQCIRG